jgi:hypothetical protein
VYDGVYRRLFGILTLVHGYEQDKETCYV